MDTGRITINKQTNMKENTCIRCEHSWYQRKPEQPRICPKCKSPYWDLERQKDLKAKEE